MPKSKLVFIVVLIIVFFSALIAYLKIDTLEFQQKYSAYSTWFNPTDSNLQSFYNLSTNSTFAKSINVESENIASKAKDQSELFDFLREAQKTSAKNIYAVTKNKREAKVPIDFIEVQGVNLDLPEKISYILPGALGYEVYSYDLVLFSQNKDSLSSKYLNLVKSAIDPISRKTITGKESLEDSKADTTEMFTNLFSNLKDKSTLTDRGIDLTDENLTKLDNKEILDNTSIIDISFLEKEFKEEDLKDNKLAIGTINIHLENCFKDISEGLSFNTEKNEIEIADINHLVKTLCKKQFIKENGVLIGTCVDCTYYPADKNHALRSDYEPALAGIDFAPGGQFISAKAYQDFKDLYNAAKTDGIYMTVTSGFRSYATQVATFNAWVQSELDLGHSQVEAEAIANTYSARAGFSEHQLGTALDLNGAGCGISDGGCSSNNAVWEWLASNGYKYGFVQSYPEGKQSETGYTTEAWHYRWIGKSLADEYIKAGGGNTITLNKFLLENGDY